MASLRRQTRSKIRPPGIVQDSDIVSEDIVYGRLSTDISGPQIDVEIYSIASGKRERSVSRVRSERSIRHRSRSRPDSSYSTQQREFRDSHHSLFHDGLRGDESMEEPSPGVAYVFLADL